MLANESVAVSSDRRKSSMTEVKVLLKGGLGNQMFQYAAARAIALRSGLNSVTLDASWFDKSHDPSSTTKRAFELDFLSNDAVKISTGSRSAWEIIPNSLKKLLPIRNRLTETSLSFDSRVTFTEPPVTLDGYFQSEKYFEDFKQIIANDFRVRTEALPTSLKKLHTEISTSKSLAIHVRRGDYLTNKNANSVYGITSLDYYQNSLAIMQADSRFDRLYVFSDDPEWVSAQEIFQKGEVVQPSTDKSIWDLWLMSAAESFIIANSSYSWWGAWLGQSSEKKVIAPSPWFFQQPSLDVDLVPESWIRVPT